MKYFITERQFKVLLEEKNDIRSMYESRFKDLPVFDPDLFPSWNDFLDFLDLEGNPEYKIEGKLLGYKYGMTSLGNLTYVGGNLYLYVSRVTDLGNLTFVGGECDLDSTKISSLKNLEFVGSKLTMWGTRIENLGKLKYVGGDLITKESPVNYTVQKELKTSNIYVGGQINPGYR